MGLGTALYEMHAWCREHAKGGWAQHHHSTPRGRGVVPIDYARFYFERNADAEAFRRAATKRGWLP